MRGASAVIFPALIVAPAWLGLVALQAGVDDRIVIAATVGGALLCQMLLERALPYRHEWRARAARSMKADAGFVALAALTGAALDLVAIAAVYQLASFLATSRGGTAITTATRR